MPRAVRGVLVECDESIKTIITSFDKNHEYIIEDLDARRLVVKENMIGKLKEQLKEKLSHTIPNEEDSSSDDAPAKKG